MMGIDMDPSVIRQFVDQLKNADDDTLKKFKDQYKEKLLWALLVNI